MKAAALRWGVAARRVRSGPTMSKRCVVTTAAAAARLPGWLGPPDGLPSVSCCHVTYRQQAEDDTDATLERNLETDELRRATQISKTATQYSTAKTHSMMLCCKCIRVLYSCYNLPFSQSISQTIKHFFMQTFMHFFTSHLPSPRVRYIRLHCIVLVYIVSHSVTHT